MNHPTLGQANNVDSLEYTLAKWQDEFINSDTKRVATIAAKGCGKAQPLFEPILTPNGFVFMHQIGVGDYVIGSNGKKTKVTGVFFQGKLDVFNVKMSDGTSTRACGEHLWSVQTGSMKNRNKGFKTLTTHQIRLDLKNKQGYNKWYLPLPDPIEFNAHPKLTIPPYSLGAILGDGGLSKGNEVIFSSADIEIVERISDECEIRFNHIANYDYRFTNKQRCKKGYSKNHLVSSLRELGLMGTKSDTKFIPKQYLYADIESRKELLRGLLDTDGCIKKGVGTGGYTTVSPQLAHDVEFLCRSLGLATEAKRYSHSDSRYKDYYNVNINSPFNPFWIRRKADRFNTKATQGRVKGIEAIEYEGKMPCQCISVESEDNLYVTKDFILTHNTWSGARFIAVQVSTQPDFQHLIMLNTLGQARDIFYQDIEPLLQSLGWDFHFSPQYGNLNIFGTTFHLRSAEKDSIKRIESIYYASGWADEVSFYDFESYKTFISRIRVGKSFVRVTSMPDDPEHWMYNALSKGKFTIHEKSLYDNPDKKFVANYEEILKSIYDGAQLRRYLNGERVSLAGLGLFNVQPTQKIPLEYNKKEDIFLFWDFNVEYRAVSVWQQTGVDDKARPIVGCIDSFRMNEKTVYEDATVLAKKFKNHESIIYLGGDASENKRSSQTTESIWQTVRRAFKEEEVEIRSVVPNKNPNVKDTIQCVNWALGQGLVFFDKDEHEVYNSMQSAKADKYGEVDKSSDYTNTGARSHHMDTARYFIFHIFKHLYPGGSGRIWAI